jgi:acyl carrier protein
MKDKILELVTEAANELNQFIDFKMPLDEGRDCELYGQGGLLDSISLVTLIVKVEEKIENEFDVGIILASEKAMSQHRSPFHSIGTLSDYIESLLTVEVSYV